MLNASRPASAVQVATPHGRVILASSLGTGFEWYDFFLYGSLAAVISKQFFAGVNETSAFIFALLTFAAGFAVRPFGALVFGRLGDLVGRKKTFLATIIIMGTSTTLVGFLPTYQSVGIAAPIMLIGLRMLQGLAIGGEYGGAVIYVAEHVPSSLRGRYTSWIQTTATLALLLSLIVILVCRAALGAAFESWGWRIPFLVSVVLLAVSVYVRLQLAESPVFQQMVAEGSASKAPIRDAFSDSRNVKRILSVLIGATAGMNVVWYGGSLYALYFLTQVLKVGPQTANLLLAAVLVAGTPLYLLFGRLSDRVGRKKLVMLGMALAALTYFPIYRAITHFANPAIAAAAERFRQESEAFAARLNRALAAAGYPVKADPAAINTPMVLLMLLILMVYVTLVTAPMAAWLVELFPARVRYTSLSVPYHIGAGWFGGFLPAVAFTLVAITGDIYSGLWYPVIVAAVTVLAGVCLLPETVGSRSAPVTGAATDEQPPAEC